METPISREERRRLLLEGLIDAPTDTQADEGSYDPRDLARRIRLGRDRGSDVARMVSWHESYHAFLNASTCHGCVMMFSGILTHSGFSRFEPLVRRMLSASLLTHETFATVSAISVTVKGAIDGTLLANYPGYDLFLNLFAQFFPGHSRPVLSQKGLAACARVAMQTPIYARVLAQPCEAWPDIDLDAIGKPDERFAMLMTRPCVDRAVAAMDDALRAIGGRFAAIADPGIDAETERQIWSTADSATSDRVSRAAFDSFAESLAASVGLRCQYDEQKEGVAQLIAKVEAYAGDKLTRRLRTTESSADDETSLFSDFRNEQLILREDPLPIVLVPYRPELLELFILDIEGQRHVQLVAMPRAKARALYAPIRGGEFVADAPDAPDDIVVGLRQRVSPEGAPPRIEFLVLGPDDCQPVLAPLPALGVELVVICSHHLFHLKNWFLPWLLAPDGPANRMAVLMDDDPIELMSSHGERGAHLQLTFFRVRTEAARDDHTEIVCFAAADEPDAIYFTPCSSPFRIALMEYARRRYSTVSFDRTFVEPWMPMFGWVMSHVLREEGHFGNRFWR
jgi:hypothetical protein